MFSLSQDFHRARLTSGKRPRVMFSLTNAFGVRVYSDGYPPADFLGLMGAPLADGSVLAGGRRRAGEGALPVLEAGARVLSFGKLRETLSPLKGELAASLAAEEPGSLSLVLANGGGKAGDPAQRPFSRLEARENLLGAAGELAVGFDGLAARDYLTRFTGRVTAYRFDGASLSLTLRSL